ncbi:hypothetical protein RB653_001434 [Dictyostelium firmibasis]|uniref:Uncharacterized protein n=1 Tax=Dictyostelium firmibasis TaxID=79012 RepID=A0AAN7TYJ5_9MYCE
MISSNFNNNATPDFLISNNNYIFFNNNANIPAPLTNRLPYTNKFFNNQINKEEIITNNNNNNNNNNNINNINNNNSNNSVEYDVPTLSPQILSAELLSSPQKQQINSPSPSSSSVESSSVPQFPQYCSLKKCELCERGQPALLLKTPTWSSIMRVVFFTLHNEYPEKQYFSLKTEVYEFMTSHWERLCINRKRTDNWRKQIQDMLSHSKNVFESGLEKLKQNGFWKLRNIVDPWVINENKISSSTESSPVISSNQWKKKRSFDDDSNNIINSEINSNKKLKTQLFTPISSPSLSSSPSSSSSTTTTTTTTTPTTNKTTTIISTTNDQSTPEIESIDNIFGKEIQSIRIETKKLFKLLPSMKNDQNLTKEALASIQLKLSKYENRLNYLEKEKESYRISIPFSPFPISNKLSFNINNYSEPSSPSQQIPSSPSQSTDVSRSNSPIPAQTPKNNCNNNQKLFFA